MRSKSVTRQDNFNGTKIGQKCQHWKLKWDILDSALPIVWIVFWPYFFASKTNQIHFAHRIDANWLILSDFQRLWEKGRKRRRTYPRKNVTWIVVLELIVDTFKRDDGSAFLDFRKIKIHLCSRLPLHSVWKSPKMSHLRFSILAFSPIFILWNWPVW